MRKVAKPLALLLALEVILSACSSPTLTPAKPQPTVATQVEIAPAPSSTLASLTEPADVPTQPPLPTSTAVATQAIANTTANLRAGPNTSFAIVGSAQPGQPLQLVARNSAGNWLQLTGGEWISAPLVDNVPNLPVAQAPGAPATGPPTTAPVRTTGILIVSVIDVGQGDSILIQAPDGHNALIDGGEANSGALAYLQTHGVNKLDLLVATHPHSDHIGGLPAVLKAIPVAQVVSNGQPHTTGVYEQFLDAIIATKAKYTEVKRGDILPLGNLSLEVLSPSRTQPTGEMNDNSLVLRLVYGKVSFQFEGDAQADAENLMRAAGVLTPVTFVKVGHHGSRTSSSPAFLSAIKPKVAVYSAGTGNPYGHPHAKNLANLQAAGAEILGTDRDGTVVITSDGTGYQVTTSKAVAPRARPQPVAPVAPAPAVAPTQAPAPAVQAGLGLNFVSVTSPTRPGSNATLMAKTAPGAACSIVVHYKSAPSKAAGVAPTTAGGDGTCSWTWKVGTNTTPGTWLITVMTSAGGQTVSKETSFRVAR